MAKNGGRWVVWVFLLVLVGVLVLVGWYLATMFYAGLPTPDEQLSEVIDRLEELEERQSETEGDVDGLRGSSRWPWYVLGAMLAIAVALALVAVMRPSSKFGSSFSSDDAIREARRLCERDHQGFHPVRWIPSSGQRVPGDPLTKMFLVELAADFDRSTLIADDHECITYIFNNQDPKDWHCYPGMNGRSAWSMHAFHIQKSPVMPSSPERITHIHHGVGDEEVPE